MLETKVSEALQKMRSRTSDRPCSSEYDELNIIFGVQDCCFVEGFVCHDSALVRLCLAPSWTERVAAKGLTLLDGYFVVDVFSNHDDGRPAGLVVLDHAGSLSENGAAWVVLRGAFARWNGDDVVVDASGPVSEAFDFSDMANADR